MLFKSRRVEIRKVRKGVFRALVYFGAVTAVSMVFAARHAHAEIENQTLELGRQMAQLAGTQRHDVTGIVFNGQRMQIGSIDSDLTPSQVLDKYSEYCKNNTSAFLTDKGPNDPPDAQRTGFMRSGSEREGMVLCFVKGSASKPTNKEAVAAFAKTGELGAIGELRYTYAAREQSGKTLVLTAWTDSKFNLVDIVPKSPDADVAGEDFAEAPRPPSSQRILATRAEGTPYAANVYRTALPTAKIVEFYDKELLKDRGWQAFAPKVDDNEKTHGRAYFKNGVVVTVAISKEQDGQYVALGLSGVGHEDKAPIMSRAE